MASQATVYMHGCIISDSKFEARPNSTASMTETNKLKAMTVEIVSTEASRFLNSGRTKRMDTADEST